MSHKDDKQTNVAQRRRNHKIKNKIDLKTTYFNKKEREKRVRGVIMGQKLTINHPSLVDEGEETKVFGDGYKPLIVFLRGEGKSEENQLSIVYYHNHQGRPISRRGWAMTPGLNFFGSKILFF